MDRNNPYAAYGRTMPGVFSSYIRSMQPTSGQGFTDERSPTVNQQVAKPKPKPTVTRTTRSGDSGVTRTTRGAEPQPGFGQTAASAANPGGRIEAAATSGVARTGATGASTGGSGGGNVATAAAQAGQAATTPPAGSPNQNFGTGTTNTAFGDLFKPEAYADAWADPEALINTYLNHVGSPTNTGGAAMTQNLGPGMGIRFLMANNGKNAADLGHAGYLDWAGEYLNKMRTPGATSLSLRDVMGQVLNPEEGSVMYNNMYSNDKTAGNQVDAVMSTLRGAGDGSAPSLVMQSLLTNIANLGEKYRANALTGQNEGNFGEYLRNNGVRV